MAKICPGDNLSKLVIALYSLLSLPFLVSTTEENTILFVQVGAVRTTFKPCFRHTRQNAKQCVGCQPSNNCGSTRKWGKSMDRLAAVTRCALALTHVKLRVNQSY